MRTIKQVLIILIVLLVMGHVASYLYLGSSDRKVPPVMHCPDDVLEVSSSDKESVLLQGITATDPQDGDITNRIVIAGISKLVTSDTAKVTFIVFDSDDNMASCVRRIRYTDYHRPTFSIVEPLVYSTTEEITILPRLEAQDVVDGNISNNIRVSTREATSNSEIFYVSIQVTNSVGDTSLLKLPVMLLQSNPLRPEVNLTEYLVYVKQGGEFNAVDYLKNVKVPGEKPSLTDVQIEDEVDTANPDTYYVRYTYASDNGIGSAILTVVVE